MYKIEIEALINTKKMKLATLLTVTFLFAIASAYVEISVAHASPDAPAVDIYLNGTLFYQALAFSEVGATFEVPAGVYEAVINVSGGQTTVLSALIPATADGTAYLVAAVNPVAYLNLNVYAEEPSGPVPSGTYVSFLHASPDAPPVDIAVVGGSVVFAFQSYLAQAPAIVVPKGTYSFEVLLAGTSTVVLQVPNVPLFGNSYTIIAEGLVQAGTLQAVLFQQA